YDTVCYGSKPAFLCALEAFGAGHIVTGSDYPVLQDWEVYRETFAYIERLGLPKEVTDEILHHNAQKLFGFDHKEPAREDRRGADSHLGPGAAEYSAAVGR